MGFDDWRTHDFISVDRALRRAMLIILPRKHSGTLPAIERGYLFSAKGVAFISSLGQRLRDSCNAKPSVLKAQFIPEPICVGPTVNRSVESRFQRWPIIRSESWGDAPGWHENALLALNGYERGALDPP